MKLILIWLNFERWSNSAGRFAIMKRIYIKNRWTPFVTVERRYTKQATEELVTTLKMDKDRQ